LTENEFFSKNFTQRTQRLEEHKGEEGYKAHKGYNLSM